MAKIPEMKITVKMNPRAHLMAKLNAVEKVLNESEDGGLHTIAGAIKEIRQDLEPILLDHTEEEIWLNIYESALVSDLEDPEMIADTAVCEYKERFWPAEEDSDDNTPET